MSARYKNPTEPKTCSVTAALAEKETNMKTLYICEGCGHQYDNEAEARACEAQTTTPKFKVGDIVTKGFGYWWFDGEAAWVRNIEKHGGRPGKEPYREKNHRDGRNCFDGCCTMGFYYVITAIDEHEHRARYHIRTLAMEGNHGHSKGWVSSYWDELPIKRATRVPAQVRLQAATMRREKFERCF